ncbi:9728_t:CDS:2, partial [Paraglomus occultum]
DVIKTEELIDYLQRLEYLDFIEADFDLRKSEAFRRTKLWMSKVNGEDITYIKQFNPVFEEIDDDKALEQCMNEITLRLTNLETMQDSTNEATRCIFITSILNASLLWLSFDGLPIKKKSI